MTTPRTLLLMRHARALDFAPGLSDAERPLTDSGIRQANEVGDYLRGLGVQIDKVLCSAAVRTRQTWEALGMTATVEHSWDIYNAGSDAIRQAVGSSFDEQVRVGLVIGHAPGIPALVHGLADPERSDAEALSRIGNLFPTGTIVTLEVDEPWSELSTGRAHRVRTGS